MRYMLDTNVCIDLIRERSAKLLSRLKRCRIGDVGISTITLAELHHGAAKSSDPQRNRMALQEFCAPLTTLPFSTEAACQYGLMRSALERQGTPIGPLDLLIAAHALAASAVLVTANEREFTRVPGLRVENWLT